MKIYTGDGCRTQMQNIISRNMGVLYSARIGSAKEFNYFPCIIDNGAYPSYLKGQSLDENKFINLFNKLRRNNYNIQFVVMPDKIGQGKNSYWYSLKWAKSQIFANVKKAIAIQDGLNPDDIAPQYFDVIFLGGTTSWKWSNAKIWGDYCKSNNLHYHIGACGTLEKLYMAEDAGADSCDSSSFIRNRRWDIVDSYKKRQSPFIQTRFI